MLAREEVALGELIQPLAEAKEAGADAMVTPCPLCHLSLDAWQGKAAARPTSTSSMPIFHLAQLVGAAAGLTYDELLFKRHVTKTHPATDKIYAAGDRSVGHPPCRCDSELRRPVPRAYSALMVAALGATFLGRWTR